MADIIFQGGFKALVDGDLEGAPDIRLKLVMSAFSAEVDAINLEDFANIDEFDGLGYQEIDCENVDFSYDSAEDEYQLTFDAAEFNADGETVTPGSDDAEGLLVYLYVDGTDANDIAIGYTDSGGFPVTGANTAIQYTPNPDGLLVLRAA